VGCTLGWGILFFIAAAIYIANLLLEPVGVIEG